MRQLVGAVLLVVFGAVGTLSAEPWSVKLGYPPGRRVVILNVQEIGLVWESNDASAQLLDHGMASSASVVIAGPWSNDFAKWAAQRRNLDIGLSVALTNPYPNLHWHLVSSEQGPTTLVNADGHPWKNAVQFAVHADPQDVQREIDAQIDRARKLGIPLSHLSSFQGMGFARPDIAEVFLAASQKYWLPMPVVELTPELIDRFRREGFPVDDKMIRVIGDYAMPKLDDLQLIPAGESYEQMRDYYCKLLQILPPGLTQIVARPMIDTPGARRVADDWQYRVWCQQLLADPMVRECVVEQQIIVTDWREIMKRFERTEMIDAAIEEATGAVREESDGEKVSVEGVEQDQ